MPGSRSWHSAKGTEKYANFTTGLSRSENGIVLSFHY